MTRNSHCWHARLYGVAAVLSLMLLPLVGGDACDGEAIGSRVNVIVDADGNISYENATALPFLPTAKQMSYGHVRRCSTFNGTIVVGGTLSLGKNDAFYGYSQMLRRSVQIFLDWLNEERGGVDVGGSRYAMRFHWVDDASSKQQVSNATVYAISGADFANAPYSSGLTDIATRQSAADGKIMLAPTAAATSVYMHNNLTFGTLGPAATYLLSSLEAVKSAAAHATDSASRARCATASHSSRSSLPCSESIKVGFVQVDAVFTRSVCEYGPTEAQSLGLEVAMPMQTVARAPTVEQAMTALGELQAQGVTVVVGCTYYDGGAALIEALERMDYSPLAVVLTSTVATPAYAARIAASWWQGEYILGASPWHASVPVRGTFSGMTSAEFAAVYRARHGAEVSYHGASQFAACCALAAAIEEAGSLETDAVGAALRQLHLSEFYGDIGFNEHGQNYRLENYVLQYAPQSDHEDVVYPERAVTVGTLRFPMPSWAQRRCRAVGPGLAWEDHAAQEGDGVALECSGNGFCDAAGACQCADGWSGDACAHHKSVEDAGFPIVLVIIIVGAVLLAAGALLYLLRWHLHRRIKQQAHTIHKHEHTIVNQKDRIHHQEDTIHHQEDAIHNHQNEISHFQVELDAKQRELDAFKNSVVGMRLVLREYLPCQATSSVPVSGASLVVDLDDVPTRVMWYWAEGRTKLGSHNPAMIKPPHWVQYAGSVALELEDAYQSWKTAGGSSSLQTDLTDRISSTGTESKAFSPESGYEYEIDFQRMVQINLKTKFERAVERESVLALPQPPTESIRQVVDEGPDFELEGEDLLSLQTGSIVQLTRQKEGWAFGSVVYVEAKDDEVLPPLPAGVSRDAGWFPMDHTSMPSADALANLRRRMGGAGADCLDPPVQWTILTNPSVVECPRVLEPSELKMVVDAFKATLSPTVEVQEVLRIQNQSLWQSFAVKRQTVVSREQGKTGSSGALERAERTWLFHGTSADTVQKIVQQGFNRSFCGKNATSYGKGVYFARDASYSCNSRYAPPDDNGVQHVFLCRVVVGEYCLGVKNALTPSVREGHTLYDSTVDNLDNPGIFVTYHDAQAYPEYLVKFKK